MAENACLKQPYLQNQHESAPQLTNLKTLEAQKKIREQFKSGVRNVVCLTIAKRKALADSKKKKKQPWFDKKKSKGAEMLRSSMRHCNFL